MSYWTRLRSVLISTASEGDAPRYRLNGRDLLDPTGVPVRLFGMNEGHSVFDTGYFLDTDPALFKTCNSAFMRIELHMTFGQTDPAYTYPGSVDLFDVSHPETGYLNPDRLERAFQIIEAFTSQGILVGPAWHSKYLRQFFPTDSVAVAQMTAAQVYFFGHPRIRLNPLVIWGEHMNEPDPTVGGQFALNLFYLALIAAVRAVHPTLINMVGPKGSYSTGQLAGCYLAGMSNVGYVADCFVQGSAPDQEANQVQRVGDMASFSATYGAFVFGDQVGGSRTDDPTGAYILSLAAKFVAAGIGFAYWECTAPGTGPTTFWTPQLNDGVNPPSINATWQAAVAGWGASFSALRGVSLN